MSICNFLSRLLNLHSFSCFHYLYLNRIYSSCAHKNEVVSYPLLWVALRPCIRQTKKTTVRILVENKCDPFIDFFRLPFVVNFFFFFVGVMGVSRVSCLSEVACKAVSQVCDIPHTTCLLLNTDVSTSRIFLNLTWQSTLLLNVPIPFLFHSELSLFSFTRSLLTAKVKKKS